MTSAEIENNMRPGKLSTAGFLHPDETFLGLKQQDSDKLEKLGISYQKIADALDAVTWFAQQSEEVAPTIFGKFKVLGAKVSTHGSQKCPFGACHFGNKEYKIINLETNQSLVVPSLMIDMIRDHSFFEGGPYRIAPENFIDFFQFQKTSYKVQRATSLVFIRSDNDLTSEFYAVEKGEILTSSINGVRAYKLPYIDWTTHKYDGRSIGIKIRDQNRHKPKEEQRKLLQEAKEWGQWLSPPETLHTEIKCDGNGESYVHLFVSGDHVIQSVNGILLDKAIADPGLYIYKEKLTIQSADIESLS